GRRARTAAAAASGDPVAAARRPALPRHSSSRVATRSISAIASGALVFTALVWFFLVRAAGPPLPDVKTLGAVAPEVADAARQALDSLAQYQRDVQRWGRVGMVCEGTGRVAPARDA